MFGEICRIVGPACVDALGATLRVEAETPARLRAADIIVSFRAGAVPRLAPFLDEERWFIQCNAADLLGRIGSPEAAPLLQPLLRRGNPKVMRHAVAALAGINDPAAARAIHTVLRTATGEMRRAVIDALVAGRDVRVVPMLVRILDESEPLGKDHAVVLDTLGALKQVHTDNAVRSIAGVMRHKRWFARRRTRNLKNTAVDALAAIGSDASRKALDDAVARGDRLLRKIAKAKLARPSA
jgi:HEAT repeat protein